MKLELFAYGLLLVLVGFIAFLPVQQNNIEKSSYCMIDSAYVLPTNEFTSTELTKYHTKCGFVFSSNRKYYIGDSVQIKTIIIE